MHAHHTLLLHTLEECPTLCFAFECFIVVTVSTENRICVAIPLHIHVFTFKYSLNRGGRHACLLTDILLLLYVADAARVLRLYSLFMLDLNFVSFAIFTKALPNRCYVAGAKPHWVGGGGWTSTKRLQFKIVVGH